MVSHQVLGQGGEQNIPSLIARRGRVLKYKRPLNDRWFPPVFLEELPNQFPSDLGLSRAADPACQVSQCHWAVPCHGTHLQAAIA